MCETKSSLVALNADGPPVRRNAPLHRPRTELRPGGCLPADAPEAGRISTQPPHRQAVVGTMRGGVLPAVWLAHRLGIRDVRTVEVTHTTDDGINAAKTRLPAARNPASLGDLTGLDVLLVDDIAGSASSPLCLPDAPGTGGGGTGPPTGEVAGTTGTERTAPAGDH
ncbi:phosphoribosyltransferase family protein [Streptomyces sp. NPDC048637]|uniref:phosphoribosyltransferase family protein n=1 Tax=Streptomyces sp. NPDC048637 TaxID=3155636 RepID=UPI0034289314